MIPPAMQVPALKKEILDLQNQIEQCDLTGKSPAELYARINDCRLQIADLTEGYTGPQAW